MSAPKAYDTDIGNQYQQAQPLHATIAPSRQDAEQYDAQCGQSLAPSACRRGGTGVHGLGGGIGSQGLPNVGIECVRRKCGTGNGVHLHRQGFLYRPSLPARQQLLRGTREE